MLRFERKGAMLDILLSEMVVLGVNGKQFCPFEFIGVLVSNIAVADIRKMRRPDDFDLKAKFVIITH